MSTTSDDDKNGAPSSSMNYEHAPLYPLSQKRYTLVEVPMIVKSDTKAIDMLGGVEAIEKSVNNESKLLELKFREGFAHGAHGDKIPTNHLLLRVKRNIRNKKEFKFDVMGQIVNTIAFRGMVDFQYRQEHNFNPSSTSLTINSQLNTEKQQDQLPQEQQQQKQNSVLDKSTTTTTDQQMRSNDFEQLMQKEAKEEAKKNSSVSEELNIPPAIFSRFDKPLDYEFRANPLSQMVTVERPDGTTVFQRQLKKKTSSHPISTNINFGQDIPTGPPDNVVPLNTNEEYEMNLFEEVKKLFDRRPVWSRKALEAQFESKKQKVRIRYMVPHIAFYFNNGPWRRLWLKFGLDPRNDPSLSKYQAIDFRVPLEFKEDVQRLRKQRGLQPTVDEGIDATRLAPMRRAQTHEELRAALYLTDTDNTDEQEDDDKSMDRESYMFSTIPLKHQCVYQACDIRIRQIQDIVQKTDPNGEIEVDDEDLNEEMAHRVRVVNKKAYNFSKRKIKLRNSVCDDKTGWFTLDAIGQIRYIMSKKLEYWITHGDEDDEDILEPDEDATTK
jgi:general transcription factor 3C polypeptide 5 (transcription factor C subunit 1)